MTETLKQNSPCFSYGECQDDLPTRGTSIEKDFLGVEEKVNRTDRKTIISYFRDYKQNKSRILEIEDDCVNGNLATDYSSVKVKSSLFNYYEESLICRVSEIENLKKKCLVVENTVIACRSSWNRIDYMEIINKCLFKKTNESVFYGFNGFSERTFKRRKDEILEIAFMWAREFGLIKK